MTSLEELSTGICPNCKTIEIDIRPDFIKCRVCGIHGDPKAMRWCDSVPVFKTVDRDKLWMVDGQIYKKNEQLFVLSGWSRGCHRVLTRDFCDSCSEFIPEPTERPQTKRKSAVKDGKFAAAGEEKEVEI